MCISVDNSFKVKMNAKQEGIGYKVMEKRKGKYYSDNVDTLKSRPMNRWLKSKKYSYWSGNMENDFGWHLFPRLVDAKRYFDGEWHGEDVTVVILEVKFQGLISQGFWEFDANMRNIVVKKMLIVKEIKSKVTK